MKKLLLKSTANLLILAVTVAVLALKIQPDNMKINRYKEITDYCSLPDGNIAENARFTLKWQNTLKRIMLEDKNTGGVWSTTPAEAIESDANHPVLDSPITIEYIDKKNILSQTTYALEEAIAGGTVAAERIENGIRAVYYFINQGISIPVKYVLTESGINISIETKEITEGKNRLYKISLAPFFCSISNTADKDSYLFVPSGSGAIIYPKTISRTGETVTESVFGDDLTVEKRQKRSKTEQVLLPVFGVKKSENAVFGIIDGAAEQAAITASVGAKAIGYSAVYPTFQVRGNADLVAKLYSFRTQANVYANEMTDTVLSVSYCIMKKEKIDYSGFAEYYRDYMKSIFGNQSSSEETLLNLRFIGGVNSAKYIMGVPVNNLYALTDIESARKITDDIMLRCNQKMSVELIGFGESGYDIKKLAGGYKTASKLGGAKALKMFCEYCDSDSIDLYFTTNLISFSKSGNGWLRLKNTARGVNGQPNKIRYYDRALGNVNGDAPFYYMLSRGDIMKSVDKFLDKSAGWGLNGLGLGELSYSAYSDTAHKSTEIKGNMSEAAAAAAEKIKAADKAVLSSHANSYAAWVSDRINEAPTDSSVASVYDETVPFYQMVFKGYKPISGKSVNFAADRQREILFAAESGSGLTYTLTDKYYDVLVNSFYNGLNLTVYDGLKDEIAESVKQLEVLFNEVRGCAIARHTVLADGLRLTEFSNGIKVYTNYSDRVLSVSGVSVPPKSFKLKGV